MPTAIFAKIGVAMLEKLVTQTFFSKVLVYSLQAWSKQTPNKWDDQVTAATAEAFGVPIASLGMEETK